ncbi:MAG: hypothetical protein IKK09_05115 [Clostridia bacterium]|nr:hypothetical protein [Clostridia bacterium]
MSDTRSLIIIIAAFALCVVYVLWIKKTKKIKEKRKAIMLLIGILIEIFLGFVINELLIIIFPPQIPPDKEATTIESINNSNDITIEIINNNYNNNYNNSYIKESATSINSETNERPNQESNLTYSTTVPTKKPTVSLSFEKIQFPLTDNNVDFRAYTSFKATKVTLYCEANGVVYGEFDMKTSDLQNWTFGACFYESNTYVFTAIAEGPLGEVRSTPVTVLYPF